MTSTEPPQPSTHERISTSLATALRAMGHKVSAASIPKLLGQLDPNSTRRYAHLADETLRTAANSFGDASSKWIRTL